MMNVTTFAAAKGFTPEQLAGFGVRDSSRGVEIPYYTAEGIEHSRIRIRSAIVAKDGSEWTKGDDALIPYGLNRPVAWSKRYVFVTEGETDCWALWTAGKPALGIPGAQMTKCLEIDHVDGADVIYVIQEPGEAGEKFPLRVATRLYSRGFLGEVYAVQLGDAKDPHELWARDPEAFGSRLFEALAKRVLVPRPAATPKPSKPVTRDVTSLSALFSKPRQRAQYLIDGLLPANGIMLAVAKPKVGKSELVRNIAHAVVTGGEFLGRSCKQGKVVWIRLEEPFENFLDALEAMGFAEHADSFLTNEDIPPEGLMEWLADVVDRHKPALVVIDTWHKLTRVDNINDYAAVNLANEPLMRLREKGVAQIWVHHSNKGIGGVGDAVLGSSALFAACDTLVGITRKPNDERSVQTVQRVGIDLPETIVTMDPETHAITIAATREARRLGIIETEILELLNDRPDGAASKSELAETICRRRADIMAAIDNLEERRMVTVDRNPPDASGHKVRLKTSNSSPRELSEQRELLVISSSEPHGNRSESSELRELQLTIPESSDGSGSSQEFPSSESSQEFRPVPGSSRVVPAQFPARFGALGNAYVCEGALACVAAPRYRWAGPPTGAPYPSRGNYKNRTKASSPRNPFRQKFVPVAVTAIGTGASAGTRAASWRAGPVLRLLAGGAAWRPR